MISKKGLLILIIISICISIYTILNATVYNILLILFSAVILKIYDDILNIKLRKEKEKMEKENHDNLQKIANSIK